MPTRDSVLFVTLDSCRYDTLKAADAPSIRSVGPLRKAQSPSYFTYGAHSAMFVGFTPGATTDAVPLLNPKYSKLFKLIGAGFAGKGHEGYLLEGEDIVDGFGNAGFATIGSGAVSWFDPNVPTGKHLTRHFHQFHYVEDAGAAAQVDWLLKRVGDEQDVFVFLNVGETHVPYHHLGAPWDKTDNPCHPFQTVSRQGDCRDRQKACVEYLDRVLAPIINMFLHSTILVCADHGDCWGEDGVWEHGVSHPMILTVPMMMRLRGTKI